MFVKSKVFNMKTEQIDSTDQDILLALRTNCRRSAREIAKEIGISPAVLIERLKRLEQKGIVKGYVANLDFLKLGYEFMGFVQIAIEPGHLLEAQEKISKLKGVYAVYDITGEYDSVALVIAKTRSEFSALIKKIHATPHIKRTNTSMVLNVVQDPFSFKDL